VIAVTAADEFQQILQEFPQVVNIGKTLPLSSHGVEHHLLTSGPPISSKFRRLDALKFAAAKQEFAALERDGIVRRSSSPWASPLHMVQKADGSWRPCGDYRRLNLVTTADSYPIPNIMDFSSRASGCRVFTKLDLRKGYHQIPMRPADILKTAITTPFGLFEYTRMTFGLRNAGNTFQRLMDRVLAGADAAFAYLDDVLIASPSLQQHKEDVRDVFSRLESAGLVLNGEKCVFAVPALDFLGHHVTAAGITPLAGSVEAILQHPQPTTVKQLQAFLGVVNFYRRFVPAAARILRPLTEALRGSPKPTAEVEWSPAMETAMTAAKKALAGAALLAHPDSAAELALAVDASAEHVGATLQQRSSPAAGWQPLGFFSKKLEPAQVKYSAFDRELLACCLGIRHFRYMLEGRRFAVLTDHKPLIYSLSRSTDPWTARQSRQLSYVAEFTSDLRHIAGTDNVVADLLSRPPSVNLVAATDVMVDYQRIAAHQEACPATAAAKSSSLHLVPVEFEGASLLCDISRGEPRPLIPAVDRRVVFSSFHGLAHLGARATRRLMAARVVWRGMNSDIAAWCKDCQDCQRAKVSPQPATAVQPIPIPHRRFSHIHLDLVGPLPPSPGGHQYLFTIIDRTTRWLEAVPLRSMDTAACVDALLRTWVARFGVPSCITSDQGRQFTSAVWQRMCDKLGIEHITTTAYHPQSNGMIERAHRQIKDALRARLAGTQWFDHLPWVLLGLRSSPKEDSGLSSAEMIFGAPLSLPGELLTAAEPPLAAFMKSLKEVSPLPTRPLSYAEVAAGPRSDLLSAEHVYVRRGGVLPPLSPQYMGPYAVLQRRPKFFLLKIGDRQEAVSVDRLKPHLGKAEVLPAPPPRRGRPPAAR
jgi:transposase InsO family protein